MPSQGDYRLLAQYFLALAKACTEPSNADRYRVIAADYFDLGWPSWRVSGPTTAANPAPENAGSLRRLRRELPVNTR